MTDVTTPTPSPAPAPSWRPRRRGYLFPTLLILVGGLFFLGNLGYLPPLSVHGLLSLWPLVLILFGIELIFARRSPLLALVLELGIVVLGIALVAAQPSGILAPVLGGTTPSSSFTVPRGSSRTLDVRVEGGAGTYTLRGGASALVDAHSDNGELAVRDDRSGDRAEVRVQPAGTGDVFWSGGRTPSNVNVRVASDVPTSLRVSGGAGDFTVDLSQVLVQDARVDTGASRLELTLPTPSGDVPVHIGAGAATIAIVVPDGVEARITTSGAILSLSTVNPRFGSASGSVLARSGSTVETPGYAAATDRVTVTVSAGASSITIR